MSAKATPFPVHRDDLGPLENTYGTRSFSLVSAAAYLACAVSFAFGVFLLYVNQKLATGSEVQGIPKLAAMVMFGLSFACLLGAMLHKVKSNRVALFENGIAVETEGIVEAARWDEVLHYYNSAIGAPFRFTLRRGGEISFSNETADFSNLVPRSGCEPENIYFNANSL